MSSPPPNAPYLRWREQRLPTDRWLRGRSPGEWLPKEPVAETVACRRRISGADHLDRVLTSLTEETEASKTHLLALRLPRDHPSAVATWEAWKTTLAAIQAARAGAGRRPLRLDLALDSPSRLEAEAQLQAWETALSGPGMPSRWCWGNPNLPLDPASPLCTKTLLNCFAQWPRRPAFLAALPPGHPDPLSFTQQAVDWGFAGIVASLDHYLGAELVAPRCWLGAKLDREPLGRFCLAVYTAATGATLQDARTRAAALGLNELTVTG